jgi:hypothetical protein
MAEGGSGALFAFVLYKSVELRNATLLAGISVADNWLTIAAFAVGSYVLGHFLFVVASLCLDPLCDWWKETFRDWCVSSSSD